MRIIHSSNVYTNEVINLPYTVKARGFRFVSTMIPNLGYNITTANNRILINEGGESLDYHLTPGFYSAHELCAHIESVLNASELLTLTYSAVFNETTQRCSLSATGSFYPLFSLPLAPWNMLGFSSLVNPAPATSHLSDKAPTMMDSFFVISSMVLSRSIIKRYVFNESNQGTLIGIVPIDEDYKNTIITTFESDFILEYADPVSIRAFDISLKRSDGITAVDLQGASWTFMIDLIE